MEDLPTDIVTDADRSPFRTDELDAWRSRLRVSLEHRRSAADTVPSTDVTSERWRLWKQSLQIRVLAKTANGMPLDADERAAREHGRHGEAVYRRCLDQIGVVAPGCVVLKGLSLAQLYPPGWVRTSADLDLLAPTEDLLWAAGQGLLDDGWQLPSGVAVATSEGPRLSFTFERPCPGCDHSLAVELMSVAFFGDPVTTPPRLTHIVAPTSAASGQIGPLLEESFQRPFTLRDVFDAWLLTHVLPDSPDAAWGVVDQADLWPEYERLLVVAKALRAPGPPAPVNLESRVRAVHRLRRQRRTALLRRRSGWAYVIGRRLRRARGERWREVASRAVCRLSPPAKVYEAGLPVCGLRLDEGTDLLAIRSQGGRLSAVSPLGRFAFTHAPELVVYEDDA